MFDIINIKPNNYDKDIHHFINIVSVNNDNFLKKIIELLNPKNNICKTINVFQEQEYIYQMIFIEKQLIEKKVNKLASLLNKNNKIIYGNAILVKYYLPLNNFKTINANFIKDDIEKILKEKDKINGVKIFDDGKYENIEIKFNEFDKYMKNNNIKNVIEYSIYGYNLLFFINETNNINDKISSILKCSVKGNIIILSKNKDAFDDYYDNITINEIKKILVCISKNIENSKIKLNEKNSLMTKYRILENKYINNI